MSHAGQESLRIRFVESDTTLTPAEALQRLKLPMDASAEDVTAAFRKLALDGHPDHGGSNERMGSLTYARDVALAALQPNTLPAARSSADVAERQTAALVRLEERRLQSDNVEKLKRTLIRQYTSDLTARRRSLQLLTGLIGGLTALGAALRALSVVPLAADDNGYDPLAIPLAVLALVVVVSGAQVWWFRMRVQRVEFRFEQATETMSDRPTCLHLLDEIEGEGGKASPWTPEDFSLAMANWSESHHADKDAVATLARRIGVEDFRRLFAAKVAEQGLLREEITSDGTRYSVRYVRTVPDGAGS